MPGVPLQNSWEDIQPASGNEYLGYPTQKPLALLERIICASSNEGDVVLDPFCGCGTAVHAAEKLKRQQGTALMFKKSKVEQQGTQTKLFA
jgi:DNA modification methylase